jgi:hypothetical protein
LCSSATVCSPNGLAGILGWMDDLSLDSFFFFFFVGGGGGEANWLERYFEDDEVFEVVKVLYGDKASGPNGFTIVFSELVVRCLN